MGEAKRRSEAGLPPKMDQNQVVKTLEVYAVDHADRRRKILLDENAKSAVAKAIAIRYGNGLLIDPTPVVFAAQNLPALARNLPMRYIWSTAVREGWRRMWGRNV